MTQETQLSLGIGDDEVAAPITPAGFGDDALARLEESGYSQDLDLEEAMFPRLRLIQGLSPEVNEGSASPGDWKIDGFDDVAEPILVIPMSYKTTRTMRSKDGAVLCKSADGKTGTAMVVDLDNAGGECMRCPFAKWNPNPDNPAGKNLPPDCTDIRSYLLFVPDVGVLAQWDLSRTGITTARALNGFLTMYGFRNFGIELEAREETRGSYRFWAPKFKVVTDLSPYNIPYIGGRNV